jgi:hypothetical protein
MLPIAFARAAFSLDVPLPFYSPLGFSGWQRENKLFCM